MTGYQFLQAKKILSCYNNLQQVNENLKDVGLMHESIEDTETSGYQELEDEGLVNDYDEDNEVEKGGVGSGRHKEAGNQAWREAMIASKSNNERLKRQKVKEAEEHYNKHAESLSNDELIKEHTEAGAGTSHQVILSKHLHQRAQEKLRDQANKERRGEIGKVQHVGHAKEILQKSSEFDLEKGGEGSRGGKVIGHTRSGKPIYDSAEHESHKDFTKEDHKDASEQHKHIVNLSTMGMQQSLKNKDKKSQEGLEKIALHHADQIHKHDKKSK